MTMNRVLSLASLGGKLLQHAARAVLPYADVRHTRESAALHQTTEVAKIRFGESAVEAVASIAEGLSKAVPFGVLGEKKLDDLRMAIQSVFFRVMNWSTDKVQHVLPDISPKPKKNDRGIEARRETGIQIARKFESFTRVCSEVAGVVKVQQKLSMDSGRKFIDSFDAGLLAHPAMAPYADKDRFYGNLKHQVYQAVRKELQLELGGIVPSEIEELLSHILPHDRIKEKMRELLDAAEQTVTDPLFLKDSFVDLLNICSSSMEGYFKVYLEQLESPVAEDVPVELDTAYGKALIGLLRIIEPKLVNINLIKFMEWFLGREKMLTGEDRLTRLLAELTQVSVEESLETNVNIWVAEIVKLIREKYFDAHNNYIERPSFITSQEWERLEANPENRPLLNNPESPLIKQIKKKHEDEIHKRFRSSCVRMMQAVSVATLVFEQYLLTPRQVAKSESKSRFKRFVASLSSKVITLPLVRVIIELFHRMTIWIRVKVAKVIGWGAGISLAHRASLLFESRAPSLLYRQLLVEGLQGLKILPPTMTEESLSSSPAALVPAPLVDAPIAM